MQRVLEILLLLEIVVKPWPFYAIPISAFNIDASPDYTININSGYFNDLYQRSNTFHFLIFHIFCICNRRIQLLRCLHFEGGRGGGGTVVAAQKITNFERGRHLSLDKGENYLLWLYKKMCSILIRMVPIVIKVY